MARQQPQFPKLDQNFFPLAGGLDLVTPAIEIEPGKVISSCNYEPAIAGGYRRINGYERYSGLPSPSAQSYWKIGVSDISKAAVDAPVSGSISGASGVILAAFPAAQDSRLPQAAGAAGTIPGYLILGAVSGTFVSHENMVANAVTLCATTSTAAQNGASLPSNHADYALLAANYQRSFIQPVPGSGPITGVWLLNNVVYAFRNNAAGTANLMYRASSAGWVLVPFYSEVQLQTLIWSATVTVTTATPAVVSWASHGMSNGQPVQFASTGTLPTGIGAGVTYYLVSAATGTFELATTVGGSPIGVTGAGSGTLTCTALGNNIYAGNVINGKTSGATATVAASLNRTGTWESALTGSLVIDNITGTFNANEVLEVSGMMLANTSSTNTQIVRQPCTSMQFCIFNFSGATGQNKLYGADSVNPAFEFDGTNYVPIHTGMVLDTPTNLIAFGGYLWLSFGSSVQYSGLDQPYSWNEVQGAGQFLVSDTVTGFLPQKGTIYGNALAIFTQFRTFIVYGQTASNFVMVPSIMDVGMFQGTMQMVSNDGYGMTNRGIQSMITTLNYGNFDYASISHMIQPLITQYIGMQTCSNSLRSKNQYRVYFSDGTALVVGLTGDKFSGILQLNYGIPVACICTQTPYNGQEVTYFGSNTGYVYQDNIGTSQDGNPIAAWLRLPFFTDKGPNYRKRWLRAIFDLTVDSFSHVNVSYDFDYSNPMVQPSAPQADTILTGSGGYWDQFTWDQFTWDSQLVSNPRMTLNGTEKSLSMLFYSNRAQDGGHTLQGITFITTVRRFERQ